MAWGTQDSFAGISLNVLAQGRSRTSRAKLNVREVPGGNVVIINNGGQGARRRQYDLYVPDEDTLAQLESLCGATADLVYWGGVCRAVLEELDASDWWMGGQQKVRASFVVVSQPAVVEPTPAPTASFVYGNTGFLVELDINSSTTPDGLVDVWHVEWGEDSDGDTVMDFDTYTAPPGGWTLGSTPTQFHTYTTPGQKIVTVSIERNGVLSADYSAVVEVAG